MTEILKLKELPNDGLESSRGALRLGIRPCFGFNGENRRPQGGREGREDGGFR